MGDNIVESWKKQIDNEKFSELNRIDGQLWNSSGRFSHDSLQWESSMRFKRWWENYSVNLSTSKAGTSSCQCLTTLYEMQKEMMNLYGTYDSKPDGSWNRTAEKILLNFAGSGHPIFRGASALERGELRSKGSGKKEVKTLQWPAPKILSCFSKWSSPSISSVPTEQ